MRTLLVRARASEMEATQAKGGHIQCGYTQLIGWCYVDLVAGLARGRAGHDTAQRRCAVTLRSK